MSLPQRQGGDRQVGRKIQIHSSRQAGRKGGREAGKEGKNFITESGDVPGIRVPG